MWVWFLLVILMMVVVFLAIGTVLYSTRLSGNTTTIQLEKKKTSRSGYIGGFAQSNKAFAYPDPDLSSLIMEDNLANTSHITRVLGIKYPIFSWETQPGKKNTKRVFLEFPDYIAQFGYDNRGQIHNLQCPQIAFASPLLGMINAEVSITGVCGWVDEKAKSLAADATTIVQLWFSPEGLKNSIVSNLRAYFDRTKLPFPNSKRNSVKVTCHAPRNPKNKIYGFRAGSNPNYKSPDFADVNNKPDVWAVGYAEVTVGEVMSTGHPIVDNFNAMFINLYNECTGGLFKPGTELGWNIGLVAPADITPKKYREEALCWRASLDMEHCEHSKANGIPKYYNGKDALYQTELDKARVVQNSTVHLKNFLSVIGAMGSPEKDAINEVLELEGGGFWDSLTCKSTRVGCKKTYAASKTPDTTPDDA